MPQSTVNLIGPLLTIAVGVLVLFAFVVTILELVKKRKGRVEQTEHESGLNWVTLELRIPAENIKSPKSMEQVFASLHAIPTEDRISFEIVGFAESTHFYIHLPDHLRKALESAIFSQYPNAEVIPVEDYVGRWGANLPDDTYDIAGSELVFSKDSAYPLRTYPSFNESEKSEKEEYYIDPISTIAEVMSGLGGDEMIWLQIILRPLAGKKEVKKWDDEAQKILDEMLGRKPKEKAKKFSDRALAVVQFIGELISAFSTHPSAEAPKKEEKPAGKQLSPGENDVIRAIENKHSKFVFESTIRALYTDRRSTFSKSSMSSVIGALRQFGSPQLNSFKLDEAKLTFIEKTFSKEKKELQAKKDLFASYGARLLSKKPLIISTEELATMYHPPHATVAAEKLNTLEMKRGAPPINLPTPDGGMLN
ncbi:hypothetical protein M1295_00900 [Patescibacteria group bacterium]|nr:hypothetical protein [Patescibacteria group bacterium]